MCVKHCRLTRFQQLRLLEYFVAGTPSRTAADLVGIHRNSAIRFFYKLRQQIAHKQAKRAVQFCGEMRLIKVILAAIVRENEVGVRQEKLSYLVFSSVAVKFTPCPFQT